MFAGAWGWDLRRRGEETTIDAFMTGRLPWITLAGALLLQFDKQDVAISLIHMCIHDIDNGVIMSGCDSES